MSARAKARSSESKQPSRMSLLKAVLQGYRSRLDEELLPLGITTAQLRLLVAVDRNPEASGARLARICSITPQTGQAIMLRMIEQGWVVREPSGKGGRTLCTTLTVRGRALLRRARTVAERLDGQLWAGEDPRQLRAIDRMLQAAVERLGGPAD